MLFTRREPISLLVQPAGWAGRRRCASASSRLTEHPSNGCPRHSRNPGRFGGTVRCQMSADRESAPSAAFSCSEYVGLDSVPSEDYGCCGRGIRRHAGTAVCQCVTRGENFENQAHDRLRDGDGADGPAHRSRRSGQSHDHEVGIAHLQRKQRHSDHPRCAGSRLPNDAARLPRNSAPTRPTPNSSARPPVTRTSGSPTSASRPRRIPAPKRVASRSASTKRSSSTRRKASASTRKPCRSARSRS